MLGREILWNFDCICCYRIKLFLKCIFVIYIIYTCGLLFKYQICVRSMYVLTDIPFVTHVWYTYIVIVNYILVWRYTCTFIIECKEFFSFQFKTDSEIPKLHNFAKHSNLILYSLLFCPCNQTTACFVVEQVRCKMFCSVQNCYQSFQIVTKLN